MRYWISIKMFGPDWKEWHWSRVCACDSLENVGIVERALVLSGQVVQARDMQTEGHPILKTEAG